MSASILWLIAGAALLALEAFGIPGVGFLFVGIGALGTAITVELDIVNEFDYVSQFATFFITSAAITVLLWKKLKAWRIGKNQDAVGNMVGDKAIVGKGGLIRDQEGQVQWSGTTLRAVLANDAPESSLPEGRSVTIIAVKGNLATVK